MIRVFSPLLAVACMASLGFASTAAAQQEVYRVAAKAGQPTYVNFHFYFDDNCAVTLPTIEFVSLPETGRTWTSIDDYTVKSEDLAYGSAGQCAGKTIQALYVAYQPDDNAAGNTVEIVYDRVLDQGDARWFVQVDIQ